MHFCSECSNMYYIRLAGANYDKLIYYCRKCGHEDKALGANLDNICISRTQVGGKIVSSFGHVVNEYTKLDPTLPRLTNIKCPSASCPSNQEEKKDGGTPNEVIYVRYDDANMSFVYICSTCDTIWKSARDV